VRQVLSGSLERALTAPLAEDNYQNLHLVLETLAAAGTIQQPAAALLPPRWASMVGPLERGKTAYEQYESQLSEALAGSQGVMGRIRKPPKNDE
jgi:hypothetical protein